MKILAVADLHARKEWMTWVSQQSAQFDVICIAGDCLDIFKGPPRGQIKEISAWLMSLPCPTVICSGNHDFWPKPRGHVDVTAEGQWLRRLAKHGQILAVDGQSVMLGGFQFHAAGWTSLPTERCDILIFHAPPSGCSCAFEGNQDNGDSELWKKVQEAPPRLILAGHIHAPRAYHVRIPELAPCTTVLVPGFAATSPVPMHWSIDLAKGTATHSSGISTLV